MTKFKRDTLIGIYNQTFVLCAILVARLRSIYFCIALFQFLGWELFELFKIDIGFTNHAISLYCPILDKKSLFIALILIRNPQFSRLM